MLVMRYVYVCGNSYAFMLCKLRLSHHGLTIRKMGRFTCLNNAVSVCIRSEASYKYITRLEIVISTNFTTTWWKTICLDVWMMYTASVMSTVLQRRGTVLWSKRKWQVSGKNKQTRSKIDVRCKVAKQEKRRRPFPDLMFGIKCRSCGEIKHCSLT